jgi:hypothetical protein
MSSRRTLRGQTAKASRRRNDTAPEHDNDSESQLMREQEGDELNFLGGQSRADKVNSEDNLEIGDEFDPKFPNNQGTYQNLPGHPLGQS